MTPSQPLLLAGSPPARAAARGLLAAHGIAPAMEVETVEDLLARAEQFPVVILAGGLDGGSLPDLLNQLRGQHSRLRVVALTGSSSDVERVARLAASQTASTGTASGGPKPATRPPGRVALLLIASSTGGPEALTKFVTNLQGPLPVPTLVAQHIPAGFSQPLAQRLAAASGLSVREARDGETPAPGDILIAPGNRHLRVSRGGALRLDDGPEVNGCRPSADVLFSSAVGCYGGRLLGVVLTGMGADGAAACADIVQAGGEVMAQDCESSVVWGMPGAVARAGLASLLADPVTLAQQVRRRVMPL